MAFQLDPQDDITVSVRQAGTRQVGNVLKRLNKSSRQGRAVHETRKAMKRLRALLHLVRPAMANANFRREEKRIKTIARGLSGTRDIQAMLECLAKLEAIDPAIADHPTARKLRNYLNEKRRLAEKELLGETGAATRRQLQDLHRVFAEMELKGRGFDIIARTIRSDYRKARHAYRRAYKLNEDEEFHEWRKYVQRHWRQLLLIQPGWPEALRPHIDLVSQLSEVLGDDHDIYILAQHIDRAGKRLGTRAEIDSFLGLCRKRQKTLRIMAKLMGERLFAEKPSSLAARLTAYWRTQPEFQNVMQGEAVM